MALEVDTAPIDAIDSETVTVEVDADTAAAQGEISSLDSDIVDVPVEADTAAAQAEIESIGADPIEVPVEFPGSEQIPEVTSGLDEASGAASSFGGALAGAGGAARVLTGIGLAAFVTSSISAFAEADEVISVAEQRIKSLGSSAVTSVDGMQALASEIQSTAGVSDEAVISAQTLLLTFENLSNGAITTESNFQRATQAIFDISAVQGNASSNAIALGKALEDPVAGLSRLGRAGITFTEAQKEVIAALVETGDIAGAQALILDEIEDKYGGLAEAAGTSLAGQLRIAGEAFGDFQEVAGQVAAEGLPLVSAALDALSAVLTVLGPGVNAFGRGLEGIGDAVEVIPGPVKILAVALVGLTIAARAAVTAMLLLSAASPITVALVGAAVAVTALGAALGLLDNQAADSTTQMYLTADALDRIQQEAASLGQVLAESGQVGLVDAVLQRIIDISPQVVSGLEATGTSVADLVTAIQSGQVLTGEGGFFENLVEQSGLTGEAAEEAEAALAALGLQISQSTGLAESLTAAEEANAAALGLTSEEAAAAEAAFQALSDSVTDSLPTLGDAITNVESNLNTFGQTISSSTDAQLVVDNLAEMLRAFAEFGDNLEIIATQGGDFGPVLAEQLAALGPEIAGGIAAAFAEAPEEFAGQLEFLQSIAEEENISLIELFASQYGEAATTAADSFGNKRGEVEDAARTVGRGGARKFKDEIDRIGGFADEAASSATAAVRAERDAADRAGDFLGSGFSSGTKKGARDMRPNARGEANNAIEGVKELTQTAYRGGERVGDQLAQGIAAGLEDGSSAITSAAVAAVNAAIAAARAAAQANSPSMVFAELGRDMVDGLALGLYETAAATAAASNLATATADEFGDESIFRWGSPTRPITGPVLPAGLAGGTGGNDKGPFSPQVSINVNVGPGTHDPIAIGEAVAQAAEQALWRAEVQAHRRR